MSTSAKVTEAHRSLVREMEAQGLYLRNSIEYYAQKIADSEARAIAKQVDALAILTLRWDKLEKEFAKERAKVRILQSACDRISEKWCDDHDSNPFAAGNAMMRLADKALAETEDSP